MTQEVKGKRLFIFYYQLYLFTLTPSAIADFQGERGNVKKKTKYIIQIKTIDSNTVELYEQQKRHILGQTNDDGN